MSVGVVAPLLGALMLSVTYFISRYTHAIEMKFRRRWLSFAAGVSVAYAFVDILPELEVQRRVLQEVGVAGAVFVEQRIYLFVLLGFLVFHGLARLGSMESEKDTTPSGRLGWSPLFTLQMTSFVLYNMVVGYLLLSRSAAGVRVLTLFVFAMMLHLIVLDHELVRQYGIRYASRGRVALALGVPAGVLLGMTGGIVEGLFPRMFALVAGGVVMTSAGAEVPREREGRYWYFVMGAVLYTIFLLYSQGNVLRDIRQGT